MLTKDEFVEHIKLIKKTRDLELKLCDLLTEMSADGRCNLFLYEEYESNVISLLKHVMDIDIENDWIEYFIYDLEFGNKFKLGSVVEADGKAIDLSTPEALYDYLCKYYVKGSKD